MGLEATLLLGHYSQKPLTLWVVGNGSTDHLEDIWASRIMGQTRSRVAHKVALAVEDRSRIITLIRVKGGATMDHRGVVVQHKRHS